MKFFNIVITCLLLFGFSLPLQAKPEQLSESTLKLQRLQQTRTISLELPFNWQLRDNLRPEPEPWPKLKDTIFHQDLTESLRLSEVSLVL